MNVKILILNGATKGMHPYYDEYLDQLMHTLGSLGHDVTHIPLHDKRIHQCIGCWDCWVKTPGLCRQKDDMRDILRSIIHTDLLLFASPLRLGFPSPQLKRVQERMIPLIHPYMEVVEGEVHHKRRYKKYPLLATLFHQDDSRNSVDHRKEELEIIHQIYRRDAVNFKSTLTIFATTERDIQELAYEMHNL